MKRPEVVEQNMFHENFQTFHFSSLKKIICINRMRVKIKKNFKQNLNNGIKKAKILLQSLLMFYKKSILEIFVNLIQIGKMQTKINY
jgi:hypothetical protein